MEPYPRKAQSDHSYGFSQPIRPRSKATRIVDRRLLPAVTLAQRMERLTMRRTTLDRRRARQDREAAKLRIFDPDALDTGPAVKSDDTAAGDALADDVT